jgi:hypothetical protein
MEYLLQSQGDNPMRVEAVSSVANGLISQNYLNVLTVTGALCGMVVKGQSHLRLITS